MSRQQERARPNQINPIQFIRLKKTLDNIYKKAYNNRMKRIIPTIRRVLDNRFQELLSTSEITHDHWETYLRVVNNYMKWSYGRTMDVWTRKRSRVFVEGLTILLKTVTPSSIINYNPENDY